MDAIERYERLKRRLEDLRAEQQRRQGSLETLTASLKKEYGMKTVEAAEREITKLRKDAQKKEEEANDRMDEVEGML